MDAPKKLNVTRVLTYDIEELRKADPDIPLDTVDDVLGYLEDWVTEDFGTLDVIYTDENGKELN